MGLFRGVLNALCIAVVIFAVIWTVIYRFSNPGLTETRLFLALWPLEAAAAVAIVVFGVQAGRSRR